MPDLFFYGTLRHRPLLEIVSGERGLTLSGATLPGHAAYLVRGQPYPGLRAEAGAESHGVVMHDVPQPALDRLKFYEGVDEYGLQSLQVRMARSSGEALVFVPLSDFADDGPFDFAAWRARWGDVATLAAQEVMEGYPDSHNQLAGRYPRILARATAALAARNAPPSSLRRLASARDVALHARRRPYAHFFSVEEYDLRHRRFDGEMGPQIERAVFVSGDAATVLPYDPARDTVLLTEQFRAGPFGRGDPQCWSLECVAGRIDAGETAESTARREAEEEAGLQLGKLHFVHGYYPSPAAKSEHLTSFIGECDLPHTSQGVFGVAGEDEDIRTHIIPFHKAMALMASGEIGNAPLILSLYWLAAHRTKLRKGA